MLSVGEVNRSVEVISCEEAEVHQDTSPSWPHLPLLQRFEDRIPSLYLQLYIHMDRSQRLTLSTKVDQQVCPSGEAIGLQAASIWLHLTLSGHGPFLSVWKECGWLYDRLDGLRRPCLALIDCFWYLFLFIILGHFLKVLFIIMTLTKLSCKFPRPKSHAFLFPRTLCDWDEYSPGIQNS